MDEQANTSVTWLGRLQDNDEKAWTDLIAIHGPRITWWAQCLHFSREDCEDVCQDVFVAVRSRINGFARKRNGSFRAWLREITWMVCQNRRRSRKGPPAVGGTDHQFTIDSIPDTDDPQGEAELYGRAFNVLRTELGDRAEVVERLLVDELTTKEVANQFGLKESHVRKIKCKALKSIRELLMDLDPGPSEPA